MTETYEATYDGTCLRLDRPLPINLNTRVLVTVEVPTLTEAELDEAYREMAADVEREKEALEWLEGTSWVVIDE